MSDFQKLDRDLWDDDEDERPTLVGPRRGVLGADPAVSRSESPAGEAPKSTLYERLVAAGVLDEADPEPVVAHGVSQTSPVRADPEEQELRDSDLEIVADASVAHEPDDGRSLEPHVERGRRTARMADRTPTDAFAQERLSSGALLTGGALGSIAPTASSLHPARGASPWGGRAVLVAAVLLGGFVGVTGVRHLLRTRGPEPLAARPPVAEPVGEPAAPVPVTPQATELPVEPVANDPREVVEVPTSDESPVTAEEPEADLESGEAREHAAEELRVGRRRRGSVTSAAVEESASPADPPAREQAPERAAPVEATAPQQAVSENPSASSDGQLAAPEDAEALPQVLSKSAVIEGMNAILPELSRCAGGMGGVADITLTVQSTGRVSYAMVSGDFAGTPEGSCLARAVKSAKFPPFKEAFLRVNYPIQL